MTNPPRPPGRRGPRAGLSSPFHARAALRALVTLRLRLEASILSMLDYGSPPSSRLAPGAKPNSRAQRARLRRQLARLEAHPLDRRAEPLPRCDALGTALGLERLEVDLFALATNDVFERLAALPLPKGAMPTFATLTQVLAAALAVPLDTVSAALAPTASLRRAGLVELGDAEAGVRFRPGPIGARWLDVDDDAEPMTQVFQADQPAEWAFADFAHAGLDAEILRDQLRVALAARRGVRVVVRGPEGSGRRSLVRAVAAELGAVTWRLRAGEDALSPDDLARLAVVSVAREGGVVLLVEPTTGGMRSMFQRAYFPGRRRPRPEPVEEADTDVRPDVPLVFIVDQSDDEDDESPFSMPTETPRADVVVQLPPMPPAVRERALKRAIGCTDEVAPEWLKGAATRGVAVDTVARAAKALVAVGHADPALVERHLSHLMGREGKSAANEASPRPKSALPYDLGWICTDTPADALVGAISRGPRGCMLFYGPPGTGKSALAEEVARRNQLPVITRTASQLLSKYVGENEKNLAAAFAEAKSLGAVLILDEADSFLAPRRNAQRSWEVSQVNELLVQVERFHGWLICTTNFLEGLDEAALRRFALKVRFEPPNATQRLALTRAAALALHLEWTDTHAAQIGAILARAPGLTPGDVAAVVEQVQLVGGVADAVALAERLVREASIGKKTAGVVGFG